MELRNLRGVTVHEYHIVGAAPGEHIGVPSSTVTLIVDLDDGLRLTEPEFPAQRVFRTCLGGMHLAPVTIHHSGRQVGVAVSLEPPAVAELLGSPTSELWARNLEFGDAAPALARRLYDETGAVAQEERAAVARQIIAEAMTGRSRIDPDAENAWQLIQRTRGRLTVARLVEVSGWSARYLTKVFTQEYGVGLKQAARLARFEHARERLEAGTPIADIAPICGYADQAHLTREFAAITGYPPKAFLAVRAGEFAPC